MLIDEGQDLIIEEPGCLGAIRAFSVYQPTFKPITLGEEGLDLAALDALLEQGSNAKLLYGVPNQNPSGVSYSRANREALAQRLVHHELLMVEDDPYGELRFEGEHLPPSPSWPPQYSAARLLLQDVVPAFRLGWMLVPDWLRKKVTIAKQATDLHSNAFSQQVLHRFLTDNSLDAHLEKIKEVYGRQRAAMEAALARHCRPASATPAPRGMFLWLTLPSSVSAMALFDRAIREKVAFVPGAPSTCARIQNTLRLSFSCVDESDHGRGHPAAVPRPGPHALSRPAIKPATRSLVFSSPFGLRTALRQQAGKSASWAWACRRDSPAGRSPGAPAGSRPAPGSPPLPPPVAARAGSRDR